MCVEFLLSYGFNDGICSGGELVISRAINSVNLNPHPSPMQSLPVTAKVHYAMHNISLSRFSVANLAPTS